MINKNLEKNTFSKIKSLIIFSYVITLVIFFVFKIIYADDVQNLVPNMTTNTAPEGEVSDILGQTDAYLVFDGATTTSTHTIASSTFPDVWVQYQFATGTVVNGYKIYKGEPTPPTDFEFEGSDDGSSWTALDGQTGINWASDDFFEFPITSQDVSEFEYYRLTVNDSTTTINEIEFFNYPVVVNATGTMATSTNATSTDADPGTFIKSEGAFTFKMTNNATTTINDLKINQVGTLDVDQYVTNVTLKYATTASPEENCPVHDDNLVTFDDSLTLVNGSTTISNIGGVVIDQNPTCFYIEYDLKNIDQDFWFAGQSVDFELVDFTTSQKNSLIFEKNNIDGETVLVQQGVQTLTLQMSDDVNDLSKFYVENGVLYIEKTYQERRRLTSRDVNVTSARFQKINEYQVKVELIMEYAGGLSIGAPIQEYFTTTVNMKKYDGTN